MERLKKIWQFIWVCSSIAGMIAAGLLLGPLWNAIVPEWLDLWIFGFIGHFAWPF